MKAPWVKQGKSITIYVVLKQENTNPATDFALGWLSQPSTMGLYAPIFVSEKRIRSRQHVQPFS